MSDCYKNSQWDSKYTIGIWESKSRFMFLDQCVAQSWVNFNKLSALTFNLYLGNYFQNKWIERFKKLFCVTYRNTFITSPIPERMLRKFVLFLMYLHFWTFIKRWEIFFLKTKWLVFDPENEKIVYCSWTTVYLKDPKYEHNN